MNDSFLDETELHKYYLYSPSNFCLIIKVVFLTISFSENNKNEEIKVMIVRPFKILELFVKFILFHPKCGKEVFHLQNEFLFHHLSNLTFLITFLTTIA